MSLDADLAGLQARVAALEAQQTGGDTLSPTYLTIDGQGRVSASFTGLINALGLVIPSGVSTTVPAGVNEIAWERASDGALVANVWAGEAGGVDVVQVNAGNPQHPLESQATAILQASTTASSDAVGVFNGTFSGRHAIVFDLANVLYTALDSAGNSRFVQNGGDVNVKLAAGQTNVTFSGSSFSNTVPVFPALPGGASALVPVAGAGAGAGVGVTATVVSTNPLEFTVTGAYPFGVLTQVELVYWLAIAAY